MIHTTIVHAAAIHAAFDPGASINKLKSLGLGVFALVLIVAAIRMAMLGRSKKVKNAGESLAIVFMAIIVLGLAGVAGLQATGTDVLAYLGIS